MIETSNYFTVIHIFIGIVLGYPWAWIANASDGMNTSYLNYSDKNLGLKVSFILNIAIYYWLISSVFLNHIKSII